MFGDNEDKTCDSIVEKDSITNLEMTIQSARERISRNCTSISHIMSELDKVQSLFKRFNQAQYHMEYNEDMLRSISGEDVKELERKQSTCENARRLSQITKTIDKSVKDLN